MAKQKELQAVGTRRPSAHDLNGERLHAAIAWAMRGRIFDHLHRHGNTSWITADLVLLALVWVWSGNARLTGAFEEAHGWSLRVLGRAAVGTYQGLMKALVTWTGTLLPIIRLRLQQLMQQHGDGHWRIGKWLPLAVDGTRISVPRTVDNERALCAPHYGKSAMVKYRRRQAAWHRARPQRPIKPQIWLTLVWHMGLRMPWSWKCGPSYAAERDHLRDLVEAAEFPENTLFCCDAGFTGYDLWKALLDQGHHFLIRVGANVRLLRKLGYVREREGIVYFWPQHVARRRQPPLALRLLCFQGGKSPIYLITNVLSDRELSQRQALDLYRHRWGVELQFRTVKQTFSRRKLRSKTPDRAYVELHWSLVGLWLIQLFAVKEQIAVGEVPERSSVVLAIDVVRTMMHRWSERPERAGRFHIRLQRALNDDYERTSSKNARYHPNYKEKPTAGKPTVLLATRKQKSLLASYLAAA